MKGKITIYHRDGTKTVIGERNQLKESHESSISKPMDQRILENYYMLECNQKLGDSLSEFGGKARVREVHRERLASRGF